MDVLIIAEKPSVANRLANALGSGEEKRKAGKGKVSYYEIDTKEGSVYVAAAVGHLFTIRQTTKGRGYPVLDIEWAPSFEVGTKSEHTKAYLETLQEIGKSCNRFINACDYDIEGTVIGTNVISFLTKGSFKNSMRMKFSTTTTSDLLESYKNLVQLDINNFYAGEARHMLDWLWGINLSRALTYAVHGMGAREMLSIGRVQGPSLSILAEKEKDIAKFVPKPFWRVLAAINGVDFENTKGDMFEKPVATSAFEESKNHRKNAVVKDVESREQSINPYPPFDLTTLQLEASRALRMDPSLTLQVAQSLYEKAYISYPRTSSQKLPPTLGLPKIISELAKNPNYSEMAHSLIKEKRFKPVEGAKTDEAHPAIFPTGVMPHSLHPQEERLYDMIARRFLAVFAENATVARQKVVVSMGNELYSATGANMLKQGWLSIYTFTKIDEKMLPKFEKGQAVNVSDIDMKEMKTQPPKRYTKASLISELEKRELGTKATRAQIIDTLFKRRYLESLSGTNIAVTKFGMSVFETLKDNCSMIVDESTTRKLEEDMERISKGALTKEAVIDEGKKMLIEALNQFDNNKDKIAVAMRNGLRESSILGKCLKDGGDLVIRRSRVGKQFAACANYPACTNTYSLPQNAAIVPTGKTCEHCHTPIIKVIRKGRRPFEMDLDPTCISKKEWKGYGGPKENEEKGAVVEAEKAPEIKPKKARKAVAKPKTETPKTNKKKTVKKAKKGEKVDDNVHTTTL
ncbi:MAG: DNA topoisomerase I [Candidatus Marsarchaeota archaeon]|nr:DNA topoisomerase I [Candidatus Marsarchaeota archaeon]